MDLTILIPCLNEAATIAACVEEAHAGAEAAGVSAEVLVADNGSQDGSPRMAREAGARVVTEARRGYGSALRAGIAAAHGRWIIMADADGSYDFTKLTLFVEKLRDSDLVMGCRFPNGGGAVEKGAMPWQHRWLGNPVLTALGRWWFDVPVHDFHCGMRGFSREAISRLEFKSTGMEFASEMIIKVRQAGLRIAEVPVVLRKDRRGRSSHLRTWRDGWRHLRLMLLYSPRWVFLYPGAALMLAGVVVGAWLLPGPRQVGRVELDVHTLLYASLAILIGFQAVVFSASLKMLAEIDGWSRAEGRGEDSAKDRLLEKGVGVGAGLVFLGVCGSLWAVQVWSRAGYGPLRPSETLRLVIPAMTALSLGVQTIFASFFLGMLKMRREN